MAFTLFDLLLGAYKDLGQVTVSVATGGSTTTIVDDQVTRTVEGVSKNDYRGGAVFVIRDSAGAGAAPEGQFSRCTAFAASTGTFTIDSLTSGVDAGDTYGYCSGYYPLKTTIELTTGALQELGDVECVDTTTLDTDGSDTEYSAPVAMKRKIFRVDIQTITTNSDDNQWLQVHGWEYVPAAGGSAGKIIFSSYPWDSRDIRVWYMGPHPALTTYSSVINERIDPQLAITSLVVKALEWQNSRMQGSDAFLLQKWNDAKQKLQMLKMERAMPRRNKPSKLFIIGGCDIDDTFAIPDY